MIYAMDSYMHRHIDSSTRPDKSGLGRNDKNNSNIFGYLRLHFAENEKARDKQNGNQ